MSMVQNSLKNAIKAVFMSNIPNPTTEQLVAFDSTANALAAAHIACIQTLTINYVGGLTAGGNPVVGTLAGATIS